MSEVIFWIVWAGMVLWIAWQIVSYWRYLHRKYW